jgi:hypothetical protein
VRRQAPFLFDRETMLVNDALFAEHLAYYQAHIAEVDRVIAKDRESAEAKLFAAPLVIPFPARRFAHHCSHVFSRSTATPA